MRAAGATQTSMQAGRAWLASDAVTQRGRTRMRFIAAAQVNADKAFPAQSSIRGAYVNSGSRDAGPDRPLGEVLEPTQ